MEGKALPRRPRLQWRSYFGGDHWEPKRLAYALGYDVTCECGWDSSTGGGTKRSVERSVDYHFLHGHDLVSVLGKVYAALPPLEYKEGAR